MRPKNCDPALSVLVMLDVSKRVSGSISLEVYCQSIQSSLVISFLILTTETSTQLHAYIEIETHATLMISEILIGIKMEGSVSDQSSDRNIRDHLWRWSTYFGRNIPAPEIRCSIFDKAVPCPNYGIQKSSKLR